MAEALPTIVRRLALAAVALLSVQLAPVRAWADTPATGTPEGI